MFLFFSTFCKVRKKFILMQYLCAITHLHTATEVSSVVNVAALFLGGILKILVNKTGMNVCRNDFEINL